MTSLDGLFHGTSENNMDDNKGYPHDFGNLHICSPANSWSLHGIEDWPCITFFSDFAGISASCSPCFVG